MKEEFEDILRQQLENFESEEIPAGLWEGIEQRLEAPKVVPLWKKLAAVAASLLLLCGIGVGLLNSSNDNESQQIAEKAKTYIENVENNDQKGNTVNESSATQPLLAHASYKQIASVQTQVEQKEDDQTPTASQPQEETKEVSPTPETSQPGTTEPLEVSSNRNLDPSNSRTIAPSTHRNLETSNPHFSIKLYASQMPQGGDNNMKGYLALSSAGMPGERSPIMMFAPVPGTMENLFFANANNNEEPVTNTTYDQPVRIGLSIGYDLDSRWGLNLGVVYTKLNSTLKSGGEQSFFTNDQCLRYIGVPVNVNYNILQTNNLRVYASAGEMTEFGTSGEVDVVMVTDNKCVSYEHNKLQHLPMQFSVNASAGAEYSFYQGLGVFVEPGVSYHFRDNSDISSIYKAHPLNFNLQLGLRWGINR